MWFTEDAWSPVIVCLVGVVISAIAWSSSQRPRYLGVAALLTVIAAGVFFVEKVIVTDAEQVEQNLLDLVRAFVTESRQMQAGQPQAPESLQCVNYFSLQNTGDRSRVVAALLVADVQDDIRITDVQIRLTNENSRALCHFRANATVSAGSFSGHHPSRWELTWQKEGGEWKITRTRMLNIMNGSEIRIPQVD